MGACDIIAVANNRQRGEGNETLQDTCRCCKYRQDTSGHEKRSTAVTFETTDFKVTAACASGWTESAHLEMVKYRLELRTADQDHLRQGETPLEDNVLVELLDGGEGSAGSRPRVTRRATSRNRVSRHLPVGTITAERNRTSDYGTDSDDQYEICFSNTPLARGTRCSRRSLQKQRRCFLALKNMKSAKVNAEVVLASGWYREAPAETAPSWLPVPVIVLFAIAVFVIFMNVINSC